MLGWLLVLPYFVGRASDCKADEAPIPVGVEQRITTSQNLDLAANESSAIGALPSELLAAILSTVGFADLFNAPGVSRKFFVAMKESFKTLYCTEHDGISYLNYTQILYELEHVMQKAAANTTLSKAIKVLEDSRDYLCIKAVLEAKFGHCISYTEGDLPRFSLKDLSYDLLNDVHAVSVLPYVLDQMVDDLRVPHFIRGLTRLEHFYLLSQMRFPNITDFSLAHLLSVLLPESVVQKAAEALYSNEPTADNLDLAAIVGFGSQPASLPEGSEVPLFLLRHLHLRDIAIPATAVFHTRLGISANSFWMYVLRMEAKEKASELIGLALKHADEESRCLVDIFQGPTAEIVFEYDFLEDFYQATLIRFRFSPVCNEHVTQNYTYMLNKQTTMRYHAICAFLDCGQFELAGQDDRYDLSDMESEALIDKIYWLKNSHLDSLLQRCISGLRGAPKLLKSLLRRKAEDAYVQLVWDSIQSTTWFLTVDFHCCSAPLAAIKMLMCNETLSHSYAEEMLSMLSGYAGSFGTDISKEAHVLYTVIFGEAPEPIVAYFNDQARGCLWADEEYILGPIRVPKYSDMLCESLLQHVVSSGTSRIEMEISRFRPCLSRKLGL